MYILIHGGNNASIYEANIIKCMVQYTEGMFTTKVNWWYCRISCFIYL